MVAFSRLFGAGALVHGVTKGPKAKALHKAKQFAVEGIDPMGIPGKSKKALKEGETNLPHRISVA